MKQIFYHISTVALSVIFSAILRVKSPSPPPHFQYKVWNDFFDIFIHRKIRKTHSWNELTKSSTVNTQWRFAWYETKKIYDQKTSGHQIRLLAIYFSSSHDFPRIWRSSLIVLLLYGVTKMELPLVCVLYSFSLLRVRGRLIWIAFSISLNRKLCPGVVAWFWGNRLAYQVIVGLVGLFWRLLPVWMSRSILASYLISVRIRWLRQLVYFTHDHNELCYRSNATSSSPLPLNAIHCLLWLPNQP